MKLALIAPTEIPSRRANTLQVMKMAQALAGLGHAVRLCAPDAGPGRVDQHAAPRSWDELARHYGLHERFEIEWLASHPRLKRYDYGWRAVQWARRWPADWIYTRLPQAAALASRLKIPTLLEVHDLPQGRMGAWLFRQFLRGSGNRRLVVITQALAADLEDRFDTRLEAPFCLIAPDGVDLERYENLPAPEQARRLLAGADRPGPLDRLQPGRLCAGYTGHLYPGRGAELLLDLAGRLPEIDFLVVGGEPDQVRALGDQARSRELANLILTGFVPNAELPMYQAACDILLLPYQARVEASSGGDIARYLSPMKLFEYLACERPIIASALPVLQEVLNPRNALLLPLGGPEPWEAAIRKLCNDPDLRRALGRQARQDAQQHTWDSRAARMLENL